MVGGVIVDESGKPVGWTTNDGFCRTGSLLGADVFVMLHAEAQEAMLIPTMRLPNGGMRKQTSDGRIDGRSVRSKRLNSDAQLGMLTPLTSIGRPGWSTAVIRMAMLTAVVMRTFAHHDLLAAT